MVNKKIQFIETTPEELNYLISCNVKKQLDEFKKHFQPKETPKYYTIKEVSKLLKVDKSTLHNWHKSGKLPKKGIGGRVLYLQSDIENLIIDL